jgi:hypothetical protein
MTAHNHTTVIRAAVANTPHGPAVAFAAAFGISRTV